MRLREIFRFELGQQVRRPWPWLAFLVLLVFAWQVMRAGIMPVTLPQDFILNSPFAIASVTVFSSMVWLLVASALAGEAGARDLQSGMHTLMYTMPLGRTAYLGGRFLAAFVLNVFVLLAVQAGILLGVYAGGVDPAIIGPFRPAAHLAAFAFIALPNAFVVTAVQFSAGLLTGRSMAGYLGSVVLMFFTFPVPFFIYMVLGRRELALLMDPIGMFAIMNEMMSNWTLIEKNVRMFTLDGAMLRNRLVWLGIATLTLAIVHSRFRFAHRASSAPWTRLLRRVGGRTPMPASQARGTAITVPEAARSFGTRTRVLQTLAIARSSFQALAISPAGLFLFIVYPAFIALVLVVESQHWGVPLIPLTGYILPKHVVATLTHFTDYRLMIPLVVIYLAGELVWRERDARVAEYADAAPVRDWSLMVGRYLGLGLMLAALMAALAAAVVVAQVVLGHHDFQLGLSLTMLFGLQLPEYLLFAILAFAVHIAVNQKHVGMMTMLVVWFLIIFAPYIGVEHNLLVYGAGPAWSYTEVRGFGGSIAPWLWFRLYWAAWALLLAVSALLLWVRGRETRVPMRLRNARLRFTPATARVAAMAVLLVAALGGFVFYNTNVVNEYTPGAEVTRRRAEYELRYGRFDGRPQPSPASTRLRVEIHPERRAATIRGSHLLINRHAVPIDSVHVEPAFYVETDVTLDRAATLVLADRELGHFIYALAEPLEPGDSLTLDFEVRFRPRGFGNGGRASHITANATHFSGGALPLIGYQQRRELTNPDDRREYGLPRQVTLPAPGDVDPRALAGPEARFEAIVGTRADQVAVAPGELRRSWLENGRRYFHYVSDVPIGGDLLFFSADYEIHRERWNGVELQVFLHRDHTANRERLLRSARASLDYYSAQFGPYPYRFLQFVEQPGSFLGMGVDGSGVVTGGEGFFLLNPTEDGHDLVFEVVAHEVAHQWWAVQVTPAFAEGGILLSESLAWYSAMQVTRHALGEDALRRLRRRMLESYPYPPVRTGMPLLRAMDPWAGYRGGPFAFHALGEYIGHERVNAALSSLVRSVGDRLATTLDLHRELIEVTPDSMRYLLRDLFETNTFWQLTAPRASAVRAPDGSWEVTLDVHARKVVADTAGGEAEVAMDEWIQIGVFERGGPRDELSAPLYVGMHRIRSGEQTIRVTVPREPVLAGVDPYHLLDWTVEGDDDNIARVDTGTRRER